MSRMLKGMPIHSVSAVICSENILVTTLENDSDPRLEEVQVHNAEQKSKVRRCCVQYVRKVTLLTANRGKFPIPTEMRGQLVWSCNIQIQYAEFQKRAATGLMAYHEDALQAGTWGID